jgi:hypothetical protein
MSRKHMLEVTYANLIQAVHMQARGQKGAQPACSSQGTVGKQHSLAHKKHLHQVPQCSSCM